MPGLQITSTSIDLTSQPPEPKNKELIFRHYDTAFLIVVFVMVGDNTPIPTPQPLFKKKYDCKTRQKKFVYVNNTMVCLMSMVTETNAKYLIHISFRCHIPNIFQFTFSR